MSEESDVFSLIVPFQAREHSGEIRVRCEPNRAPEEWGMAALGLPMDLSRVHGFPVLHATIDFEGSGYDCMMGWIQVLDIRSETSGRRFHLLDKIGALDQVDMPYNTFGYLPTLFDAPALDALPGSIITWRAQAFLTVCPDVGVTRRVACVAGFQWGFDVRHEVLAVVPPRRLEAEDWAREVPFLRDQHPAWTFIPPEPGV